jgi:ABC-type Zn uptake system ZnuABC Zn-binding protein ZnuA
MIGQRGRIAVLLAAALTLSGCSSAEDPWKNKPGPPRVVVSFPPLVSFVKNVGGEQVGVYCICTTTGPHEYKEPKTADFLALRGADVFVINGLGLDEVLAERMKSNVGTNKFLFAELGEKLPKKLLIPMEHEEGEAKEKHEHEHGEFDPHIWLGTTQACAMVEQIRDKLKEADKKHAADYDKNAAEYIAKLKALQSEYRPKFMAKKKEDRKIVSFHDSLRYFAESFGVEVVAVIEPKAGEELSAAEMTELVKVCVEHKPHAIATESQYSEKAADELVNELKKRKVDKVKLVLVDPLETADPKDEVKLDDPKWYETKMRQNLDNLLNALP